MRTRFALAGRSWALLLEVITCVFQLANYVPAIAPQGLRDSCMALSGGKHANHDL